MTITTNPELKRRSRLFTVDGPLNAEGLRFLAGCAGPCITLIVPDRHPGAPEGSRHLVLRSLVREAAEQIEHAGQAKHEDQNTRLLAPLHELAELEEAHQGGAGFAIFRSPEVIRAYATRGPANQRCAVGGEFQLLPFLGSALAPQEFYVLGLSKKRIRLIDYTEGVCREVPIPRGVPASLEEFGDFDKPDHRQENRSPASGSAGANRAVSFGTSVDRENAPEYLHAFFVAVDRGLKSALGDKPVLLGGVHEEVQAYIKAAVYPRILHSQIKGNIENVALQEIAGMASEAAAAHYVQLGELALAAAREMPDRQRVAEGLEEVLDAALQGRVHQLCVRGDTPAHETTCNAAVAATLRNGGDVFLLPPERMAGGSPLVAILRYAAPGAR